jgi:hypothetical protein
MRSIAVFRNYPAADSPEKPREQSFFAGTHHPISAACFLVNQRTHHPLVDQKEGRGDWVMGSLIDRKEGRGDLRQISAFVLFGSPRPRIA